MTTLDQKNRDLLNLILKPKKCIIIPLGAPVTDELVALVKDYLAREIPEWKDFEVADKGKYLGIMLGPGVIEDECVWAGPSKKWSALKP